MWPLKLRKHCEINQTHIQHITRMSQLTSVFVLSAKIGLSLRSAAARTRPWFQLWASWSKFGMNCFVWTKKSSVLKMNLLGLQFRPIVSLIICMARWLFPLPGAPRISTITLVPSRISFCTRSGIVGGFTCFCCSTWADKSFFERASGKVLAFGSLVAAAVICAAFFVFGAVFPLALISERGMIGSMYWGTGADGICNLENAPCDEFTLTESPAISYSFSSSITTSASESESAQSGLR